MNPCYDEKFSIYFYQKFYLGVGDVGRRKRGGQPGNLNALKHGFYSKQFQKSELAELEKAGDLQEEIGMMRVVTRRLLKMSRTCKDTGELVNVLGALGLASTRVAGLMRTQKFLGGNRDRFDEIMDRARDAVLKEWGRL